MDLRPDDFGTHTGDHGQPNPYTDQYIDRYMEKKFGNAAKDFLTGMLDDEGGIILKTQKDKEGKFGRILGELWRTTNYADKSINDYMIEKHHAVAYHGQSKEDIAEQHLANRQLVSFL